MKKGEGGLMEERKRVESASSSSLQQSSKAHRPPSLCLAAAPNAFSCFET